MWYNEENARQNLKKLKREDLLLRSTGIICEYNPIHLGHARQLSALREAGCEAVVCLMSGNAVQRGGFACADRYTRASAAIRAGADLVLELPYPYSMASAAYFADAGVRILDSLGVGELNFGSECGSIEDLTRAAQVTAGKDFDLRYRAELRLGKGTARAYSDAYKALTGYELPGGANDRLAISYLAAIRRTCARMDPTLIRRTGADFSDSEVRPGEYPSATALRRLISERKYEEAYAFMPDGAAEIFRRAEREGLFPVDSEKVSSALLGFFRLADPECDTCFAETGGGLFRRLCAASHEATDVEGLLSAASSKRYTDSRIRRAVFFSVTGVTEDDLRRLPEYTTILAANARGRSFLRETYGRFTVVTKPADAPDCRQRELSRRFDALFTLAAPKSLPSGEFERRSPEICE